MTLFDATPERRDTREWNGKLGRSITFDWPLGQVGPKKLMLTLTVSFSEGGVNYYNGTRANPKCYTADLRTTEVEQVRGGVMRGFELFDRNAVTVLRSDPILRYSRKQLEAFAERALAHLRENAGDARVHNLVTIAQGRLA